MRERRHEDFPLAVFRMPLGIRLPARGSALTQVQFLPIPKKKTFSTTRVLKVLSGQGRLS